MISLLIGIFTIGATVAYPVITAMLNKNRIIKENTTVGVEMLNIPKEEAPPPPPPPPPPPDVFSNKDSLLLKLPPIVWKLPWQIQEDLNAKPNTEAPTAEKSWLRKQNHRLSNRKLPKKSSQWLRNNPSYPGGDEARIKFLQENMKYPEEAKELGVQGKVFVTFVVEVDGSITDVKVLRGIGSGCDDEAVRVVKSMPKWIPGKQRGVPVRVQFNLPINFKLQ